MPELRIVMQDKELALEVMRDASRWMTETGKPVSRFWQLETLASDAIAEYAADDEFYVVLADGKPAAAAVLQKTQSAQDWGDLDSEASYLFVHWLSVARPFAGQGYTQTMIEFARQKAIRENCPALRGDTNAAEQKLLDIYKGWGLNIIGSVEDGYRTTALMQLDVEPDGTNIGEFKIDRPVGRASAPLHRLDSSLVTYPFRTFDIHRNHPAVTQAARELPKVKDFMALPFFQLALQEPDALRLWITQEQIVTNPFSQMLYKLMSRFSNKQMQSMIAEIVRGEHGMLNDNNVADQAHPFLLNKLSVSAGIDQTQVQPLPETIRFLEEMEADLAETAPLLRGIASLGVGNEHLLLAEYGAIRKCFQTSLPDVDYGDFLAANIDEDSEHSRLFGYLATTLIETSPDPQQAAGAYVASARAAVRHRFHDYYTALYESAQSLITIRDQGVSAPRSRIELD